MILPFILLFTSLLQHYGSKGESSHVSKFQLTAVKEQNGVQDSQQEKILTISGEGMVTSPNFPLRYPRNTMLVWRLVAPSNMRIQLSFDDRFGLEDPEDGICKYDFVEIEDPMEMSIVGRWCGSQPVSTTHVSKGNQIQIRFTSDEYLPYEPGFCIRYSLQPVIKFKASSTFTFILTVDFVVNTQTLRAEYASEVSLMMLFSKEMEK